MRYATSICKMSALALTAQARRRLRGRRAVDRKTQECKVLGGPTPRAHAPPVSFRRNSNVSCKDYSMRQAGLIGLKKREGASSKLSPNRCRRGFRDGS